MTIFIILLLITIVSIEIEFSPRIGWTKEKDVLLWYTWNTSREYIHLFRL